MILKYNPFRYGNLGFKDYQISKEYSEEVKFVNLKSSKTNNKIFLPRQISM